MAYFSNEHCRWFGAPSVVEKWGSPSERRHPSAYRSYHGRTALPTDPAECAQWWYRFFRREPAYVTLRDVDQKKMKELRRSIALFEHSTGKPLIFKNLYTGLRLEPLVAHLPEAVFIRMERDLIANAQSILRGRYDTYGMYEPWWSVPPPNVEELRGLPPVQQVVEQIRSVNSLLDRDLERLGVEQRVFRVQYEEFCEDVHGVLTKFARFMELHGAVLKRRFEVPESFNVDDDTVKIPRDMYSELRHYVESTATNPRSLDDSGVSESRS